MTFCVCHPSLTTMSGVKQVLRTPLPRRGKMRHFALAEKVLTSRPRSSSFLILRWTQSTTLHLFGPCSHDSCFELPAPRGGRLPTQTVGSNLRPQNDSGSRDAETVPPATSAAHAPRPAGRSSACAPRPADLRRISQPQLMPHLLQQALTTDSVRRLPPPAPAPTANRRTAPLLPAAPSVFPDTPRFDCQRSRPAETPDENHSL
jgi:hypothetical protein